MGSHESRKNSNLQYFLDCATPSVASNSILKTSVRDISNLWQLLDKDVVENFSLFDLWRQFDQCSSYGITVPLELNSGEIVKQYYAPHLSAIQIYTNKPFTGSRNVGEDSESESWSDGSDGEKFSKSWDDTSDDSTNDSDSSSRIGQLYMQYVEYTPPYERIPLTRKIIELARTYRGLLSLKSMELSPASWIAISWYPICHFVNHKMEKDLSASFLTFYTISSSFQGGILSNSDTNLLCDTLKENKNENKEKGNKISLSPFGLATYKMQTSFWLGDEFEGHEKLVSMYCAADSWLRQLKVQHHDFNFFTNHSTI